MRSSRWSSPAHSARSRAIFLAASLFAVYAVALGAHASPGSRLTGAEAHVLLTTASIADDADLDLRDQYAKRTWRAFYGKTLHPTAAPDTAGRILEPQGVGFPLILVPAYKAGGATAVRLFLAALCAIAFACAAALARRVVPDPWATFAALAVGLSPPVVAAATAVHPEIAAAAALAGAALLALRIRDDPQPAPAFWAALLIAVVPWLALTAVVPAIVIAAAMTRWLRRRRRALAGFVALEVVLTSAVVYVTVNDKLFGGPTPYAARLHAGPPTGLHDASDALARVPRVFELLGELGRWAPVTVLAVVGGVLLIGAHRERLAGAVAEHVHVEVAALFAAVLVGAQVLEAALLAPGLQGAWFPTRLLVPALPFAAAPAAWALRRYPRAGGSLAAATIALTAWMLVAALTGAGTLAPPHGFGLA